MGAVYGEKLLYIECDGCCGARLHPSPGVIESGWLREGFDNAPGSEKYDRIYCPKCYAGRERR